MRWITLLGLLAVFALPANVLAQDEKPEEGEKKEEKSDEQKAREAAERRVEWMMRAMRSLNLSDSQTEQIKKLLVEGELKAGKIREANRAEIEKLLTPEQKEQYKQFSERRGRGGRERGSRERGGSRGMMGGMLRRFGLDPEQLKEELGLTPEQEKKIQEITQDLGAKAAEKFGEMRRGGRGGFDFSKIREMIGELRKDANTKIEAILTKEQLPKFKALNKRIDEQLEQWGGMGGRRGGGERTRPPRESRQPNPEDIAKRRLAKAMEALALGQEEAAVIQPLVKKVIDYQSTIQQKMRQLREGLGKVTEEDAIKAKIEEIRKTQSEFEQKLKLMQDGLRELLTIQQEGKMISLNVLR